MHLRAFDGRDLERDEPVVQEQRVARAHVARQRLVGDAHDAVRAVFGVELRVEREALALDQHRAAAREALDAHLRAAQVAEDADHAAGLGRRRARALDPARVVVEAAVREVDADQVHARRDQVCERRRRIGCRTERRDDLGASCHLRSPASRYWPAARRSSAATAGSVLPSTNSRKAPPPVEI